MLLVKRYYGFSWLPQSYSRIFEQAERKSFFLSKPWFLNFERTVVGLDEEILIYGVESRQKYIPPVAALLLRRDPKKSGPFSPTILESLSNYYTSYFEPIIGSHDYNIVEIMRCISAAIWEDRKLWDVLKLAPFDRDSSAMIALIDSLREMEIPLQIYFSFGNWYLEVQGRSFAEYFRKLPSVIRKGCPYMIRKIQRSHSLKIKIFTSLETLDTALSAYNKVYAASWKKPEPYPTFISGLTVEASKYGWLRLGVLYIDDEPAATQLWIVNNGVASIYKIAYDQHFSKLSVGNILTCHLMRHVIDMDGVRQVDYLTGDDPYKRNWMSHRRECWGVMAFNIHTVRGVLYGIRHIGGANVKRILTRVVPHCS